MAIPYLAGAYVVPELVQDGRDFPLTLPFVRELNLQLDDRVTIFVGENGSGKSTLIEALAELVGLPWDGGSTNELATSERTAARRLASFMRPRVRNKPRNKYFFRAEALSDFGHVLEARKADPDFWGDPFARYGGQSIRTRSHGEGVRAVLASHERPGLYFFDEPEAALSPMAQTKFLEVLEQRLETDAFQFVIATHSPLIMSLRGARIISLDGGELRAVRKEDTAHWKTFAKLFAH
ncbi:MAG: AAA family ATPase [Myxococcota bacterium]